MNISFDKLRTLSGLYRNLMAAYYARQDVAREGKEIPADLAQRIAQLEDSLKEMGVVMPEGDVIEYVQRPVQPEAPKLVQPRYDAEPGMEPSEGPEAA